MINTENTTITDRLALTMDAGEVARFHAAPRVAPQTVAAHSWGVATLVLYLYPPARRQLLLEALYHDSAEVVTGDIPATFKWANGEGLDAPTSSVQEDKLRSTLLMVPCQQLTPLERLILKFADMLEGYRWALLNEVTVVGATRPGGSVANNWEDALVRLAEAQFDALSRDLRHRIQTAYEAFGGECWLFTGGES